MNKIGCAALVICGLALVAGIGATLYGLVPMILQLPAPLNWGLMLTIGSVTLGAVVLLLMPSPNEQETQR